MKVQTKLLILIIFCTTSFIGLAVLYKGMEKSRLDSLFKAEESASAVAFEKAIYLLGRSLEIYTSDRSYLGEIARFLETGDKDWAKMNIDGSLAIHKVNSIWVYKKDGSLLYSANDMGEDCLTDSPVDRRVLEDLFADSRSCRFFTETRCGPMELRGTAIDAASDPEGKRQPSGYLLAGRLWDKGYLADISSITGAKVSVELIGRVPSDGRSTGEKGGLIYYARSMNDWKNRPVFQLTIVRKPESIGIFNRASNQTMIVMVLYSILLFVVLWVSLTNWIYIPLKRISKAVLDKRPIEDKILLRRNDEFGDMTSIMNKFYEHRERLVSEVVAHRSAESALRLSEEKFAKAFRANPNPMAIFMRADGKFLDANDAFTGLTGYTRKQVLGSQLDKLNILSPESRAIVMGALEDKGMIRDAELDITTASGEKRSWIFSASAIDIGEDKIILAVANDITERKMAEKNLYDAQNQLVQAEKLAALGRFASGLAHEIKNPLAILLGGIEYLRDKLTSTEPEVREAIVKMREAIMRANIVVKDLLAFARPSKLIYEKVHPNALIHDAIGFVELFRHKSDTADIDIRQEPTEEEVYVEVDKNQIQQVLFNILLNAIEAVPMSGEIVIKAYSIDGSCAIEVRDTGHGIAKEDLPKLFEPFFTTKRDKKGTGLGLSIVKSIIERHRGKISVESELGKGTKVTITLPSVVAGPQKEAWR